MRAVVDFAKDKSPTAPAELSYYFQCQRWGSLPANGGMDDQSYVRMKRLDISATVYYAVKAWRTGKASEQDKKVIMYLAQQRIM